MIRNIKLTSYSPIEDKQRVTFDFEISLFFRSEPLKFSLNSDMDRREIALALINLIKLFLEAKI